MREHLLTALKDDLRSRLSTPDFRHLFGSWLDRCFLALQRIDWSTPAHILEKIIRYEAVHAISSFGMTCVCASSLPTGAALLSSTRR